MEFARLRESAVVKGLSVALAGAALLGSMASECGHRPHRATSSRPRHAAPAETTDAEKGPLEIGRDFEENAREAFIAGSCAVRLVPDVIKPYDDTDWALLSEAKALATKFNNNPASFVTDKCKHPQIILSLG